MSGLERIPRSEARIQDDRPFEDAPWFDAIRWPFTNWRVSRFSDGSFGAWYGCDSVEATVYETVCHWCHGLLTDAGCESEQVDGQRKQTRIVALCPSAYPEFEWKSRQIFSTSFDS